MENERFVEVDVLEGEGMTEFVVWVLALQPELLGGIPLLLFDTEEKMALTHD